MGAAMGQVLSYMHGVVLSDTIRTDESNLTDGVNQFMLLHI
jgi:hypothetical protein